MFINAVDFKKKRKGMPTDGIKPGHIKTIMCDMASGLVF